MTTRGSEADQQGPRPRLRICGPLTWDVFPAEPPDGSAHLRPGGAVTYACRVAQAWGIRAQVLAAGDASADRTALAGHDAAVVDCGPTLRFEHRPASPPPVRDAPDAANGSDRDDRHREDDRALRLLRGPTRPLRPDDLPAHWERPQTLILAPLTADDLDGPGLVAAASAHSVALLGQGLQRRIADDATVRIADRPTPELLRTLTPHTSLFLSASEIAPWDEGALAAVVAQCERLVVTRGAQGVDIHRRGERQSIEAATVAAVADTTGAGDVFATAFILALTEDDAADDRRAARTAAGYAAASLGRVGPQPLPPRPGPAADRDEA